MSGKIHSKETRIKIGEVQRGRIPWNKGKHNIYSNETLKKMSDAFKGKPSNRKGSTHSDDTKTKLRLLRIQQIRDNKNNGYPIFPAYNPTACQLFEEINKEMNWQGQHAENGGEFHIKELGYWVDYYEPNLNIVIEYDEKKHKRTEKRDMHRQKEIEQHLQCKFYRISESMFDQWRNILL